MSREIKFRAWDKRLKMWCYGLEHEGFTLFGEVLMADGFSSHFIENPAKDEKGAYLTSMDRLYNDIEVMQFTGLKDKRGFEVYEGDIVNCSAGCPHLVEWREELGGKFIGGMPGWYLSGLLSGGGEGYAWTGKEEVIGNIHQNPDLIK